VNSESLRGNARGNQRDRDADVDGINGDEEDGAANQGDGNRDGKRDKDQAGVGSFRDRRSGRGITLDAGKHKLVGVRSSDLRPEHAASVRGPLNYGLIGFEVHDVKPGSVAEVQVIMPDDSQPSGYLKEDPATGALEPFVFDGTTGAIIVGASIHLFLQDAAAATPMAWPTASSSTPACRKNTATTIRLGTSLN